MSEHVQLLLNGYIDGELDIIKALEIEEHLQSCVECTQQYRELMNLKAVVSRATLFNQAPEGFEKRIKSSIRKANQPSRPWRAVQLRWIAVVLLLVGFIIFGVIIGRGAFKQNQESLLAQEVQSAHVRSLMASHLTDITSTDQHTVKPWFDGKLDFSPPVEDLATQGFPLIGGRLDYIDNHPVAALVYQRNKHDINLFIWPSDNKVEGLQYSTHNGYNVYHWTQSGMTYWAVSDLNPDELKSFVELVQKNFG